MKVRVAHVLALMVALWAALIAIAILSVRVWSR